MSDRRNSTWLAIQFVFTLISSLITLKLNLMHFGNHIFGIWILLASIWGLGSVLDFGFGTAIVKYVAEYKDQKEKVDKILSSSFFVFIVIGVIIFFGGNAVAYIVYLNDSSIVPTNDKNVFFLVSFFLGLSFLLQYWASFFRSIIDGLNNFVFTSRISIVQTLLIFLGVVFIFFFDLSILILSLLYLLVSIIIFLTFFSYYSHKIKVYSIRLKLFDIKEIKKVMNFSLSIQAMAVLNTLIDPIIKYIIGNYYNVSSVPSYEIARRFAIAISGLFNTAFKIIMPKASTLRNKAEQELFIKKQLVKYCNFGVVYSGVAFGVFSLPIFLLMYFVFQSEEAILIYAILSLPESINNFGYAIYSYLIGVGRVRILTFIQLNNLLFVIISMSIGFIIFNSILGLLGYFFSVTIANILMVGYLKKKWNLDTKNFIGSSSVIKLGYLLFFMIVGVILLFFNVFQFYIISMSLSVIMLIVFYTDIKTYFMQIVKPVLEEKFS